LKLEPERIFAGLLRVVITNIGDKSELNDLFLQ